MTLRIFIISFGLLIYSVVGFAGKIQTARLTSGKGIVTGAEPGLVYGGGFEQKIINVQTETGQVSVFALSMGATPVSNGEKITFAGRIEKIDGIDVINTMTGYIYRHTAKTMKEQMMEQIQQQIKLQAANSEPNAVPNAVPTVILETDEQKKDSQLNFILASLSVLLALLSIEKIPSFIHFLLIHLKAIAKKFKRRVGKES
jgi:hypothetical protein